MSHRVGRKVPRKNGKAKKLFFLTNQSFFISGVIIAPYIRLLSLVSQTTFTRHCFILCLVNSCKRINSIGSEIMLDCMVAMKLG